MASPPEPLVQITPQKITEIFLMMSFYQNGTNGATPPNKGAIKDLDTKYLKRQLLLNQWSKA